MEDAKKIYFAFSGGFMPISSGIHKYPMQQLIAGEEILIAEGVETALTIALEMPIKIVIFAISLSNIGSLLLSENAGILYLCADNDTSNAAIEGFNRQKVKLMELGFYVEIFSPQQFKDFNDWGNYLLPNKDA